MYVAEGGALRAREVDEEGRDVAEPEADVERGLAPEGGVQEGAEGGEGGAYAGADVGVVGGGEGGGWRGV